MKTPTPFSFDGHGINDATGQRIAKVQSCDPYTYETGLPTRNPEFDQLSNLFAASSDLLFAAKDALESLKRLSGDWTPGKLIAYRVTVIHELELAIAKAEGK